MHTKIMRHHHKFQIQNFYCKSVTHRFSNSIFIFRSVPHGTRSTIYGTFLPIAVWLNRQFWSSLWAYNTALSKTLFFLQFIPQLNKLLVLMHIIFSSHTCSGSQTISKLCILTIKFTFSKRKIPFLAVWLNRQLVFLMGLQHCHIQDPFPPAISTFLSQTNC
jgi:hypothetical protein